MTSLTGSEMDVDEEMETKDDDTFSNSPEGSSDEEDADEEMISLKQKEVEASPYTYDLHVQLISLCRKLGDLEKLRSAREKMSELFPLTPELWLDWLTDERKLASTKEQEKELIPLFERALKDYPSVSIWLEYVQFSIGTIGENWDDEGLNNVRQTFERAVTAVGIHVAQGCLIWEAYREFENVYLMFFKAKGAPDEKIKEQEKRIFDLFKRQLSIPLIDMERTYSEFTELFPFEYWKPDELSKEFYTKALNKLKKLQPFEDALYTSEAPHYEEYKRYIQFEKEKGEPIRVQNIYERSLIENCLKEELWLDYAKYVNQVIKIKDMSLPVHERAVRNLPWCVQLWISYVRSLERYEEPHDKIIGVFEIALGMGFPKVEDFKEFWLAYLSYLRRKIDKERSDSTEISDDFKEISDVYDRAEAQMQEYGLGSESEYAIMKFWVSFTARYKKDVEMARKLWKELIDHGHKEEARVWLDYANFERLHGDATHYRKLLSQAISCVSEWQETFIDLLLAFEQEEGTLESLEQSIIKCEIQMKRIIEKRTKKEEAVIHEQEKKQNKGKNAPKYQAKVLMAPPYKKVHKKTGTRNYKAYGEKLMDLCIQDLKNKKMTQREASLKYKIPRSSITLRLKALREARVQSPGRQCIFLPFEEKAFVDHAITMYKCGFPISLYDLRCIVKMYLDSQGRVEPRFNDNLPGKCWANGFLERHKEELSHLFCRNTELVKVSLNENVISSFFSYLENEIKDVPPNLIFNYDETSLVDDPSKKRILAKRGTKYPETLKNSAKSAVSIMICGNAAGEVCPPYVVYKAEKMSDTWTIGGPPNARYNKSESGWIDSACFEDWFFTIVLPILREEDGKKVLIGDNLSSHLSFRVLRACEEHDITFISLPPNSTHLMQPLHIAYFQAFQWHWRQILDEWKETPEGQTTPTVPKTTFPSLLNELWYKVIVNSEANLLAGFKKSGICPLSAKEVLRYLPSSSDSRVTEPDPSIVTESIIKYIKMNSKQVIGQTPTKRRKKNLDVAPRSNLAAVPKSSALVPSTSILSEDMDTVTMPHVIYLKQ